MTSATWSGWTKAGRCHPRCGACPWVPPSKRRKPTVASGPRSGEPSDILSPVGGKIVGATVERDIEFARQIGEFAVIEEDLGHRPGERASINQLGRIEAGEGVAGDIAHVVEAGLLAGEADLIERRDHARYFLDGQALHLDIAAGGDVGDFVTGFVGDKGERAGLGRGHFAGGDAHAQHVAIVIGLAPEDAVPFQPMEIGLIDVVVAACPRRDQLRRSATRRSRAFGFPDFDRIKFTTRWRSRTSFAAKKQHQTIQAVEGEQHQCHPRGKGRSAMAYADGEIGPINGLIGAKSEGGLEAIGRARAHRNRTRERI